MTVSSIVGEIIVYTVLILLLTVMIAALASIPFIICLHCIRRRTRKTLEEQLFSDSPLFVKVDTESESSGPDEQPHHSIQ